MRMSLQSSCSDIAPVLCGEQGFKSYSSLEIFSGPQTCTIFTQNKHLPWLRLLKGDVHWPFRAQFHTSLASFEITKKGENIELGLLFFFLVQVSCPHKEKGEGIYCFTTLMEVKSVYVPSVQALFPIKSLYSPFLFNLCKRKILQWLKNLT